MEIIVAVFVIVCIYYFVKEYAMRWIVTPIGFVLLLPISIPIVCITGIRQKKNAWAWYIVMACYVFIGLLFAIAYL
jgi:hypothetical protein